MFKLNLSFIKKMCDVFAGKTSWVVQKSNTDTSTYMTYTVLVLMAYENSEIFVCYVEL